MKHFKKLYSLYIDNPTPVPTPQKDSKPSFVSKFSTIVITIALVILSSWGITVATTDTFPTAKEDFSAIGIVSSIESTHIIITDAQGSDDSGNTEYNINITHIDKIETNTYQDISIDDIQLNNKVIIQGKTTGSVFFATRLILFPTESIVPIEQTATSTATTTDDTTATTTEDIASSTDQSSTDEPSTDSEEPTQESDSSTEQAPTDTETQPTTEESSTTTTTDTPEVTSSSSELTDDTTATSTVIDTVTNIIGEGIDTVSNTIQNIINVVTGGNEEPVPAPEPQSELTPEPETVSEPQPQL